MKRAVEVGVLAIVRITPTQKRGLKRREIWTMAEVMKIAPTRGRGLKPGTARRNGRAGLSPPHGGAD